MPAQLLAPCLTHYKQLTCSDGRQACPAGCVVPDTMRTATGCRGRKGRICCLLLMGVVSCWWSATACDEGQGMHSARFLRIDSADVETERHAARDGLPSARKMHAEAAHPEM